MLTLSSIAAMLLATTVAAANHAAQESAEAAINKALSTLPGETAFAFTELTAEGPKPLYSAHADRRLAVGSSFKLFILGRLIEEVNAGRRRAEDIMLLRSDLVGPPTSVVGTWPMGSPVTLHTLAIEMISISDNTATDHLLYLLGRRHVERQMEQMGHGDPAVNRPLLFTREMTLLRDKNRGMPGREYKTLDEAARRKFLDKLAGPVDYDNLGFDTAAFDIAEWYASPLDMAHALAWIYSHTLMDQPAHELRAILAIDPKLPHDPRVWPFVGFKGGSEDQILAGNWLLENRNGKWYTLHLFWNNASAKVDPENLVPVLKAILAAIEPTL